MSAPLLDLPPKWPMRILRRIVKSHYLEEIEGDMMEEYQYHLEKYSRRKAKYLYIRELVKMLRPNLLKNVTGDYQLNTMGTLNNYIKIAFRNIKKHTTYSFIKIGGFSIGIAISLLIMLFVIDEMKTDRHLKDKLVYRLVTDSKHPEMTYKGVSMPPILGPSIIKDYPQVAEMGRVLAFDGFGDAGGNLFRPLKDEVAIYEERFGYADPSVLSMLEFELVNGDPKTALSEPYSLIITEQKAKKYFGEEDPVGKTVLINENEEQPYTVAGVFRELNDSHLKGIDFFFTLTGKEFWKGEQTDWCCYNYITYLEFEDQNQVDAFEAQLKPLYDGYFVTYNKEADPSYAEIIEEYVTLEMQHVSDIYLGSAEIYGFQQVSDYRIVYMFLIIALFILLLACVNFINLTTANGAQRSKEIGMRKAVGATVGSIRTQLLVEATVLSFLSVVIGSLLAWISMPFFNAIAEKQLVFPVDQPLFFLVLIAFTVVIGLVSGAYPAFFLARIKTLSVLGGQLKLTGTSKNRYLRSGLVVFQFAVSMMLIAGAFIVYQQMSFILNRHLGYDKDQVLMIHGTGTMGESMFAFKSELLAMPEVAGASFSNSLPVDGTHRNGNSYRSEDQTDNDRSVGGQFWRVDEDYFDVLGLEFVEGGAFSQDIASDSNAAVINEQMAIELGIDDPLNNKIRNWAEWRIVGVVKNFNYDNVKEKIRPMLIARARGADLLAVKLSTNDYTGTLAKMENVWNEFQPNQNFRAQFLDVKFEQMYEDVKTARTLFLIFALFGVIVACLGLFGLSVYTVSVRLKEMTVRKVLGASGLTIFKLLTSEYVKLIVIAMLIGIPLATYFIIDWLDGFEYRIDYIWDVFIYSGVLLVVISLLVVSQQTLRAATSNPSTGLRDE